MDQHLEDLGPLPALKRPYRPFQDPPMTRHCGQNIRFHHFAETVRDRYVPPSGPHAAQRMYERTFRRRALEMLL